MSHPITSRKDYVLLNPSNPAHRKVLEEHKTCCMCLEECTISTERLVVAHNLLHPMHLDCATACHRTRIFCPICREELTGCVKKLDSLAFNALKKDLIVAKKPGFRFAQQVSLRTPPSAAPYYHTYGF